MNNRKIKFRVWDEKYKSWELDRQEFYPGFNIEKQGRIYQQFIGLKDKTGREIYEGDLIKNSYIGKIIWSGKAKVVKYPIGKIVYFAPNFYISMTSIGEVEFLDEDYGKKLGTSKLYLDKDLLYYLDEENNDIQVIGNIFENPELLK